MADSPTLDYASSTPDPAQPLSPEASKRAMAIIFGIVVIDLMGFGIIIPLLPFYFHERQTNPLKVTLLFSVFSICQFIGSPILGALSDRVGRRPVLAVSQFGSSAGYILLGIATQFAFSDPTILILVYMSRVIDGFTGGNVSTAQAYVSDVTTPENRAKGMGMIGAAFGIGFALGPCLGGILGHFHPSIPAYVAAGFSAAAALLTLKYLPESRTHKPTEIEAWLHPSRFVPVLKNPMLVNLLSISFILMAAFVMMESTIGLFLEHMFKWRELGTGLYFVYIGIIIAFVQGRLIGKLVKRFGDWNLAVTGPILVSIGMLGYVTVGQQFGEGMGPAVYAMLFVAGTINATGRSLQMPTMSTLISVNSRAGEQGLVFGLSSGLQSLARVAGPIVAGLVYPLVRYTGAYVTASVMAAAMGLWLLSLRLKQPAFVPVAQQPFAAAAEGSVP